MSKKVNIGINGFGRIGRLALRDALLNEEVKVVAINDLVSADQLAYLFKYDSVHGRYQGEVKAEGNHLIIDGHKIRVTEEKNPENLAWDEVGAEIILECTGVFKTKEAAEKHLKAGAKKVVLSSPSKDIPMYVMGVNHTEIASDATVISNASCTTNCLAVLAKVVHDHFGIEEGLMTTIHAATISQATVDSPSQKNYRIGRSALNNIIPTSTGAAVAVTQVIPELKGKLTGMALRVPTANVSVVDLTFKTSQKTSLESIQSKIKEIAQNELSGILDYTEDEVVSQDFVSDTHSCIFDAKASMELNPQFFKLIAWYDNEYGYAAKLVDLALYFSKN